MVHYLYLCPQPNNNIKKSLHRLTYFFQTDYDMIDYLNELRGGCLEAYTGIVQGLKGEGEQPNGK